MEFSSQEYGNGLPFPSPEGLPELGIKPGSPALQADSFPSEPPEKPLGHSLGHTFSSSGLLNRDQVRYMGPR